MQSKFEPVGDSQFLTFVISFNPPAPLSIFPTLPVPPMAVQDPGPSQSSYLLVRFVLRLLSSFVVSASHSESSSTDSSDSISQVCIK
jgi:hypothetical protein